MLEAVSKAQEPRVATADPHEQVTAFCRIAKVREISSFSKSTLLRWIKAKKFPAPVIQEGNSTLWDLAEVLQWRNEQFQKRAKREAQ